MRSELHAKLYGNILEITTRTTAALGDEEVIVPAELGLELEMVRRELVRMGPAEDPDLLPLVMEARDRVEDVIGAILVQLDAVGQALRSLAQRRKQLAGYGNSAGGRTL